MYFYPILLLVIFGDSNFTYSWWRDTALQLSDALFHRPTLSFFPFVFQFGWFLLPCLWFLWLWGSADDTSILWLSHQAVPFLLSSFPSLPKHPPPCSCVLSTLPSRSFITVIVVKFPDSPTGMGTDSLCNCECETLSLYFCLCLYWPFKFLHLLSINILCLFF